ncbi:MAG: hypothetical protein U0183_24120 [Polyangiaceae bacterium]
MPSFVSRLAVVAVPLLFTVGCAAETASEAPTEEEAGESQEALSTCGSAKYGEALVHYKAAVKAAQSRLREGVCQSEDGFLESIADHASRAVMTCGAFRSVIRTSPWAAPVRTTLARTLTLRSLTGELSVIRDSDYQNWTGVEAFFAKGLTFSARPVGAYGSPVIVELEANGRAVWREQVYDAKTGEISMRAVPARYTVASSSGRASGPRLVTIVHAGVTEKFALGVRNPASYKDAPDFVLSPLGNGAVLGEGAKAPELYAIVSECDA